MPTHLDRSLCGYQLRTLTEELRSYYREIPRQQLPLKIEHRLKLLAECEDDPIKPLVRWLKD